MYQLSSGEGLSIQNTRDLNIALGEAGQIDEVKVWWPSGKETTRKNLDADQVHVIRERP